MPPNKKESPQAMFTVVSVMLIKQGAAAFAFALFRIKKQPMIIDRIRQGINFFMRGMFFVMLESTLIKYTTSYFTYIKLHSIFYKLMTNNLNNLL